MHFRFSSLPSTTELFLENISCFKETQENKEMKKLFSLIEKRNEESRVFFKKCIFTWAGIFDESEFTVINHNELFDKFIGCINDIIKYIIILGIN